MLQMTMYFDGIQSSKTSKHGNEVWAISFSFLNWKCRNQNNRSTFQFLAFVKNNKRKSKAKTTTAVTNSKENDIEAEVTEEESSSHNISAVEQLENCRKRGLNNASYSRLAQKIVDERENVL